MTECGRQRDPKHVIGFFAGFVFQKNNITQKIKLATHKDSKAQFLFANEQKHCIEYSQNFNA